MSKGRNSLAMKKISAKAFGVDMDPSHIFRASEDPAQALPAVIGAIADFAPVTLR